MLEDIQVALPWLMWETLDVQNLRLVQLLADNSRSRITCDKLLVGIAIWSWGCTISKECSHSRLPLWLPAPGLPILQQRRNAGALRLCDCFRLETVLCPSIALACFTHTHMPSGIDMLNKAKLVLLCLAPFRFPQKRCALQPPYAAV